MNFLVILDAQAGELEKILSGVKSMLIREFESKKTTGQLVKPGDNLYFLRNKDECDLRVRATVRSIQFITSGVEEDLTHSLKEMQPRLQLTEEQYLYWSVKKHVMLVEFESAQKIGVIHLALEKVRDQPDWTAFEAFSNLTSGIFQ